MSDAAIGFIGVIAGALTTGGLAWANDLLRRGRELHVAAIRCADRLKKIEQVQPAPAAEYDYLGGDMNEYLSKIGAAPTRPRYREHSAFYDLLRPVLMTHDARARAKAMKASEALVGEPPSRWPWAPRRLYGSEER